MESSNQKGVSKITPRFNTPRGWDKLLDRVRISFLRNVGTAAVKFMAIPNIRKIEVQYHAYSISGNVYAGISLLDNLRAVNVLIKYIGNEADVSISWGPPAKVNAEDIPSILVGARPMVYSDGEIVIKYTMNEEAPEAAYLSLVRTATRIFSS